MTPEEYEELKKRIIEKVMDGRHTSVPNPYFEACRNLENGIKVAACTTFCKRFHRTTYDLCNRGEMIVETKSEGTLIGEALDMLFKNIMEEREMEAMRL